jgi:hypothetical protein
MQKTNDIEILNNLPNIKIWGEDFEKFGKIKLFKGKFVITNKGKFIAKIVPKEKYAQMDIYHNKMLYDIGIQDPDSKEMHNLITGGGKIELEMINDYAEFRIYGESQTYGPYNKDDINIAEIEKAIEATFHLGMTPILVIPDFKNMIAKV